TESIRQHGILEPLLVRPRGDNYELVAGERRYRAAKDAGLTEVPVTIRNLSEQEAIAISLIENLQREDLNPVEETEGILQLLSFHLDLPIPEAIALLYRMRNEASGTVSQNVLTNETGQTIQSVFESLGLLSWESFITSRLPLLKLPEEILEVLRQGKIAYTKAKAISSVKDAKQRKALLEEAISQELSLSQIRQQIKDLTVSEPPEVTPERKIKDTLSCLAKSRLWEDPKKKKKFERLLTQMEALMSE
ncbi:MAG: ParB/RepB/Spo0J family partition protein, partial [Microcystaceae cyanobacterium]